MCTRNTLYAWLDNEATIYNMKQRVVIKYSKYGTEISTYGKFTMNIMLPCHR